jgi:ribosome modulation factor
MSNIPLEQRVYSREDIDHMYMAVQRRIFEDGYNARKAGFLLMECPYYQVEKWKHWWRAGWRERRKDEKVMQR